MFFDDTPMAGGTPTDDTMPDKDDKDDMDGKTDEKDGDSAEAM